MSQESKGKWLSGSELLERWNLKDFELIECVTKGLTPYSQKSLRPFEIPFINSFCEIHEVYRMAKDEHFNLLIDSIRYEHLNDINDLPPISDCLFKEGEVDYFERNFPKMIKTEISGNQNEDDAAIKDHEHPKEVINLLRKAKPEIEDLYNGMMANRRKPDQEHGETYEGALKDAAEEWFDKAGSEYQIIKVEHVRNSHLYFPNTTQEVPDLSHPSRDFQGKLCQVLICDIFSNKYISDLNNPPRGMGVKALYSLLKSL